ncbi:hypothetical protein IX38_20485 [Chryseobacterium luteum]|uniref:Uncharacterized protein n=1 Tax=Chryseobacterium luteum TaxID=421531 RepID=A0A085YYV3_9FLAO|nr:hypothetical protein IX38_20485 [Chryseobacterium luteum]
MVYFFSHLWDYKKLLYLTTLKHKMHEEKFYLPAGLSGRRNLFPALLHSCRTEDELIQTPVETPSLFQTFTSKMVDQ